MTADATSSSDTASITTTLPEWAEDAFLGDVFASGRWFRHFERSALADNERPVYLETHRADAAARIVLPMKARVHAEFPWPRILESMDNYYSCGYAPVCDTPPSKQDLDFLCSTARGVFDKYDVLRVAPIDRDGEFAGSIRRHFSGHGLATRWSLAFGNWFADVRGLDYPGYLKRVPSSFPATCEKRRASFVRRGVGELEIGRSPEGLERFIQAYESVYRSSWKVQEAHPRFIPGLIRLSAEQGWLRLGVAYVSGEPAAAQLWLVIDGRALIYKVAYDERFAKLSVGSILTCEMIRYVMEVDKVDELDFLSGDDAYKAKWMFARRERHAFWAYNIARPRGAASYARHLAGQVVSRTRQAIDQRRAGSRPQDDQQPSPRT